jgi:DNA adenine methylase
VKYGLYKKEQGDCAVVEKIENPKADESVRPLLKWTGGKRALAPEIVPLLEGYGRYFEPFFGGGAVFFKLYPESSMLSDLNPELINCYETTKNHPEELIASLKRLKNTEETYYKVRASAPRTAVNRAARFIYLCALSFNGIYRVNLSGQFNVPYGRKKHIDPCDASLIRSISKRLKTCEILCADFEQSALKAVAGDCVYFDPPYTVAHGNNGFVKYNEKIFSWKDQERLEAVARRLATQGVRVVISNADHPSLRTLYKAFDVKTVERWSKISATTEGRKKITECVFYLGGNHDR